MPSDRDDVTAAIHAPATSGRGGRRPPAADTPDSELTRCLPTSAAPDSELTRCLAAPGPALPPAPADLRLRPSSRTLGGAESDFALIELIGRGGMGVVHAARQAALDRVVAVKMLLDGADPALSQQLLIEAAVASALDHPGIVPVHELGRTDDGKLFYVMKRVQGRSWNELIDDRPLADNLDVLLRICDAIAYAHSRGVIHRDLKPHNVMLGDYGEVYVLDWGAAAGLTPEAPAPQLAAGHPIAGTPGYLAPEQVRRDHRAIGVASDVYQLGGLLFRILAGRPPHPGRSVAELLASAEANHIATVPPLSGAQLGLMAIALGALAANPADRPASVRAFQDAIRRHQEHAASLAATTRAQAVLDATAGAGDGGYDGFARALFGFEEAVSLWEGNTLARRRLAETRRAYARHAIAQGDLDLAGSLVSGDDADLACEVATAQAQRESQQRAAAALVDEQAARQRLVAQVAAEERRDWYEVLHEDFTTPGLEERWEFIGGQHSVFEGELRMQDGGPQVALLRQRFTGDLRIEFTCHQESAFLNDVSCFLAAAAGSEPSRLPFSGYEFKYGGYDNSRIVLYRSGRRLFDRAESPLRRGERYRLRAERVGNRLTMHINGAEIFSVEDPHPLDGPGCCRLGLFGWLADSRYSDLRIWQLGAPRKSDLIEVADRHLALGHYGTARDLFADAELSSGEPQRRLRAHQGVGRADRLAQLLEQLPGLRARLVAVWPQARIECGLDGISVNLSNQDITDLSPLAGMPIARLDCAHNQISDLGPLAGMPLVTLACAGNRISDLTPLAGLPLTTLDCQGNRISDLTPLAGRALTDLLCSGNRIADLAPLAGMPLRVLLANDNAITDLAPLAATPLMTLDCSGNQLGDLAGLRAVPLLYLNCARNRISDLSPLVGMTLMALNCTDNAIADLTPLAHASLQRLDVDRNRITDLSPLKGMPLTWLQAEDNPIRDLEPLRHVPLAALLCAGTEIANLEAASAMPLTTFEFDALALPESALADMAAWCGPAMAVNWSADADRVLLARRGRVDELRAQALRYGGGRFLYLATGCHRAAARALCRSLGGDLACPVDGTMNQALTEAMPRGRNAWIGLARRDGAWRWNNGWRFLFSAIVESAVDGNDVWLRRVGTGMNWWTKNGERMRAGCLIEWRD